MELQFSERENNTRLIKLIGRLDIIGKGEIETKFAGYCADDKARVVVDLSAVDLLASIGIRLLIPTARLVTSRGGKMVLLSPTPDVESVLEITGILGIIPVYSYLESAETVLMTP